MRPRYTLRRAALPLAASLALGVAAAPARSAPAPTAPNYLGLSGYVFTPDGNVTPANNFAFAFHRLDNMDLRGGSGDFFNANIYSVTYGIKDRLELGFTAVNQRSGAIAWDPLFNIKYNVLRERRNAVGLQVGVIDAADQLNRGPTGYLLISKNLTQFLGVEPGRPGSVDFGAGIGTGAFDNYFFNAKVQVVRGLELFAEYALVAKAVFGLDNSQVSSLGARVRLGNGLAADLTLPDMEPLSFGVSWTGRFGRRSGQ